MNLRVWAAALALGVGFGAAAAGAAVIAGPGEPLPYGDQGWQMSGLEIQALDNSTLTGFVFQNQGQADQIVLIDAAGTLLQSVDTPAGAASQPVAVNWALTAGDSYWLLQTTRSNAKYDVSGGYPVASDADIAVFPSVFAQSLSDVASGNGYQRNWFWADFTDITTVGAVPEPATWAMLILGVGLIGLAARRRSAGLAAAA